MRNIKAIVGHQGKITYSGLALILGAKEDITIVGREGANILQEAVQLQPDLLIYELSSAEDDEYELIQQIYRFCRWTKVLLYARVSIPREDIKRFYCISHGYAQGPILPGNLIKLVELLCFGELLLYRVLEK